jgi:hypothetical protein
MRETLMQIRACFPAQSLGKNLYAMPWRSSRMPLKMAKAKLCGALVMPSFVMRRIGQVREALYPHSAQEGKQT